MAEITTVGLDIAKRIFVAHGADAAGNTVLAKKLRREEVHIFFASLPPCLLASVSRRHGSLRHIAPLAREITALGHDARLIPPIYVKAYVVRQKNDLVDAAATCGVSEILCAGPGYPSRFDEPVVEHDSELGLGLAPFAWRHFPCLRDLAQETAI